VFIGDPPSFPPLVLVEVRAPSPPLDTGFRATKCHRMKIKTSHVSKHGQSRWEVRFREAGQRRRRYFTSSRDAEKFAADLRADHRRMGTALTTLTPRERMETVLAREKLRDAGATLNDAVDFFLRNRPGVRVSPSLGSVADDFITAKRLAGKRPRYVDGLRSKLGAFLAGREGKRIADVTAEEIAAWLHGNAWKPATMRSYLVDVRTLFKFAVARKHCADNPALGVDLPTVEDKPPGILTPAECAALLEAARLHAPHALAALAIMLLAGVRPAEALRLTWADVGRGEVGDLIEIHGAKAKTHRRRFVTICPGPRASRSISAPRATPPDCWRVGRTTRCAIPSRATTSRFTATPTRRRRKWATRRKSSSLTTASL
jgi:integrase